LVRGKTIQINTKEAIKPENWDNEAQRAIEKGKNRYSGAKDLNSFLDSFGEDVKKTIRQFKANNPVADYEEIRAAVLERFGKNQKVSLSFFGALDLFTETRKKDMSPDSIRKFKTIKKHLEEYEKTSRSELTFNRIDMMFYDRFLTHLIETKELTNNSAYKLIGILKIFLNWAYDRGINQCSQFKKFKIKEDKIEIISLTEDELTTLYNLDLKDNKRLERARDLFLFGCHTGGRFGDLVKLERDDIRNGKWMLRTGKTRDILEIPLDDYALSLLARYSEEEKPLPRLSNQKLNAYIKEVCKKAEFNEILRTTRYKGSKPIVKDSAKWELITVHTARRTYITYMLNQDVSIHTVMSISGHKSYKTFKKYVDVTSTDRTQAMNKAWNKQPKLKVINLHK
jgi:integrase